MTSSVEFHDPARPEGRAALLRALREGRILALPTETVPGLAVPADDPLARHALAALKGAPLDRPFSLHLRSVQELRALVPAPPPGLGPWLERRLGSSLTAVLPRDWVALPRQWEWPWSTVGLRLPTHPAWKAIARELPGPLLMSSINLHGNAPLKGDALRAWLEAHSEVVLGFDPDRVQVGDASTVVAFEPLPRVLRGSLSGRDCLPGMRVLVLCSGNICRSPLAAALLERELAAAWSVAGPDLQELGWVISSAGTCAVPGVAASEQTVQVARELGLDASRHRAQHVEEALRRPWDVVLCMSASHQRAVPPRIRSELFDPGGREIQDPFGGDLVTYREVRDLLARAAEARVQAWCRWTEG